MRITILFFLLLLVGYVFISQSDVDAYTALPSSGVSGTQENLNIDKKLNGTDPISPKLDTATSIWGLPISATPPAPNIPYVCISNGAITGCAGSATGAHTITGINNVVLDYGAAGNNSTDDAAHIQSAIDAACVASKPPLIYFPAPSSCYKTTTPLFLHCNNLHLEGPAQGNNSDSMLCPAYAGPVFVAQQTTMSGATLGAPLITSSTNSFAFLGGLKWYVSLNEDPALLPVTLSTFNLDFYAKLSATSTDGVFVTRTGRFTAASGTTTAYQVWLNDSNQWEGILNVNGSTKTLTDTTDTVTTGTLYNLDLDYDGSTVRFFVNGTLRASTAATGAVTQHYWESPIIGGQWYGFPDGGANRNAPSSLVDGVWISKQSRHTSAYGPCNCEPTADSNTMAIASADTNLNMLTQIKYGASNTYWTYVHRTDEDNGVNEAQNAIQGLEIDHLNIGGNTGPSTGLIGQWMINSAFHDLTWSNMYTGFYAFNNDYKNYYSNLQLGMNGGLFSTYGQLPASSIGMYFGPQSGVNLVNYVTIDGFGVQLQAWDSGIQMNAIDFANENGVWWPTVFQGGPAMSVTMDGMIEDAEVIDNQWQGQVLLDAVPTAVFNGGEMDGTTGTPAEVFVSQGGAITLNTINFHNPSGLTEVIDILSAPSQPVALINSIQTQNATTWTNAPTSVTKVATP